MTEKEFEEIYGRPPRKKTIIVKKRKIYWHRIIIALLILIGIIWGIAQIISKVMTKPANAEVKGNTSDSTVVKEKKDESDDSKEAYNNGKYQFTVCVDPGHGGYDVGSLSRDESRYEKDDCLAVSLLLQKYLEEQGVNVIMTRTDDTAVELEDRCDIANNAKVDFFLCMHRNSYEGDINGVEIWVNNAEPDEDTVLAKNIMTQLDKTNIADDRGVKYGYVGDPSINYHINADTVMPSCLIELGFMTDETDNKLFDENKEAYAKAVGDGAINAAIELGIINKDGNRIKEGQLISAKKPINNSDSWYVSEAENDSENNDDYQTDYNYSDDNTENAEGDVSVDNGGFNIGESEYKID